MKFRIVAALVLALILAGLVYMAGELKQSFMLKQEEYNRDCAILATHEAELGELEHRVQTLLDEVARQEAMAAELTNSAEVLETEKETLEEEKAALAEEIEEIEAQLQQLRETTDKDSDEAYYLEVYDALTEGLEKVKGYLAGN